MGNAVIAVIPYYGETSTIQRAVKSVLHQVGARVDAVVVVNDSHPDSPDLLLDELDDEGVLTFNLGLDGPRGPFFARNVALQAMPRNSIVGSLDADDMWHPRLLAKALKALGAANNAAVPNSIRHPPRGFARGQVLERKRRIHTTSC